MFEHFIRGGQITAHKYRMGKQIVKISLVIFLSLMVLKAVHFVYQHTNAYDWYVWKTFYLSELQDTLSFAKKPPLQDFQLPYEGKIKLYPHQILQNKAILAHVNRVWNTMEDALLKGLYVGLFGFVMSLGFFFVRGYQHTQKHKERGSSLMSVKSLCKLLHKQKVASLFVLDDLPLLKNKETSHILMTGTTGSGKTNGFHTLIPQIRKHNHKALIVDTNGEFVSRYYNPHTDILLNPLDQRSQDWNLWQDCHHPSHYVGLAKSLIPGQSHYDQFWDKAACRILSVALEKFSSIQDPKELYHLLTASPLKDFEKFFRNTEAASYTSQDGEKMTLSVRANLSTQLSGFSFLQKTNKGFSFREWVQEETPSWLFLCTRPDHKEALLPLMSSWVDIVMNALLALEPSESRRLWFILDELPSLQALPSLKTLLAESRKYGGCVLAGIQNIQQLTHIYGDQQAQVLLDLFNTYIFFRTTNPLTTKWISQVLGEMEETESHENLSYGAHEMRDGVSLSKTTKIKSLVLPTELTALQDGEAYIKLPGPYPITKLQMRYKNVPKIQKSFIIKQNTPNPHPTSKETRGQIQMI